jgi:hypothetical protein
MIHAGVLIGPLRSFRHYYNHCDITCAYDVESMSKGIFDKNFLCIIIVNG